MEQITLQNTQISFTPSFSGNGWETSLLPRFEKRKALEPDIRLRFGWIKELFLKMHLGRRKEANQWTTAIAK